MPLPEKRVWEGYVLPGTNPPSGAPFAFVYSFPIRWRISPLIRKPILVVCHDNYDEPGWRGRAKPAPQKTIHHNLVDKSPEQV